MSARTLTLAAVFGIASIASAAPALSEKPVRYEHAELHFRATTARAGVLVLPRAGGAQPVPVAPAQPTTTVRWSTADDEFVVKSWEELAEKIKAPVLKKADASASQHKLRVLNRLGDEGWEIIEHTGTDGISGLATWTLKQRVKE